MHFDDRRERIDDKPGRMPASRHSAANTNIAASENRSVSLRLLGGRLSRAAEKRHAEGLDEAGGGERRREREQRARPPAPVNFSPHCGSCGLSRIAWNVSHSETKPLSGGSAEIATQPTRKAKRGVRHAVDQAAELLHVAFAGRGQHGAGAEEQQALEHRSG